MVKKAEKLPKRAEIDKNQEGARIQSARIHVPRELYGAQIKIHLR